MVSPRASKLTLWCVFNSVKVQIPGGNGEATSLSSIVYAWVWMKYLRADFDRWGLPGVSDSKSSACIVGDLPGFDPWVGKIPWRRAWQPIPVHLKNSLDSSVGKESACNAGNPSSISGSGRSPGEGVGYPLQYSWASLVAQLVKNPPAMWETWIWSLCWEDPLEKERLPTPVFWPGEFRGLYSSWSQRIGHDWVTFTFDRWEHRMLESKEFYVCVHTQLCPTLCDPIDCSVPASFSHGIFQASILE